jgi:primase-polymerase (primpol)-like protein
MPALDSLAGEPRWVAWRNERRGNKLAKIPYAPDGRRAKADDPSTWGTRIAAETCAARIVDGHDGVSEYNLAI